MPWWAWTIIATYALSGLLFVWCVLFSTQEAMPDVVTTEESAILDTEPDEKGDDDDPIDSGPSTNGEGDRSGE